MGFFFFFFTQIPVAHWCVRKRPPGKKRFIAVKILRIWRTHTYANNVIWAGCSSSASHGKKTQKTLEKIQVFSLESAAANLSVPPFWFALCNLWSSWFTPPRPCYQCRLYRTADHKQWARYGFIVTYSAINYRNPLMSRQYWRVENYQYLLPRPLVSLLFFCFLW